MNKNHKRGRKRLPASKKAVKRGVSIKPDLAKFAEEIGDGHFSRGVQIAVEEARKKRNA